MAYFGVFGLILFLGLIGKRPSRGTYAIVAMAAILASVYEYLQ